MQRLFGTKKSLEVRDEAPHARRIGRRSFPAENGLDGIVEFVGRGGAAGAPKVFVHVINTAVIEQAATGVEDGRFRRDLDFRLSDEHVLWIAQRREFIAILEFMLANFSRRSSPARIDKPEGYLRCVLRADSLNQRRVTVGDRAVRAHEDEHNGVSRSGQKWICRGAVKMQRRLLGGARSGQRQEK